MDSGIQVTRETYDVFKWVIGAALGFLGFNVRNLVKKVDRHDTEHVSRKELRDHVDALRSDFRESRVELTSRIDKLMEKG